MRLQHYDNWPTAKRILEALKFVDEIPTEVLETLNKEQFSLFFFSQEAEQNSKKLDDILNLNDK